MEAIVAVYSDWGIGGGGTQPLVLRADRARFSTMTKGSTVIVGRRTLLDFPGGRPLPHRRNIVVTTNREFSVEGADIAHSKAEALALLGEGERCFVIGGANVFMQFFSALDTIYVTKIEAEPASDSYFPNLDKNPDWCCTEQGGWQEEAGVSFCFCTYRRIR